MNVWATAGGRPVRALTSNLSWPDGETHPYGSERLVVFRPGSNVGWIATCAARTGLTAVRWGAGGRAYLERRAARRNAQIK